MQSLIILFRGLKTLISQSSVLNDACGMIFFFLPHAINGLIPGDSGGAGPLLDSLASMPQGPMGFLSSMLLNC